MIASVVASSEASCKFPWIQIRPDSKCYIVSDDTMDHFEADLFCRQNGGDLAEPRSAEETALINEFLLYGQYYWIGRNLGFKMTLLRLTDLKEKGIFLWGSDGSEPI